MKYDWSGHSTRKKRRYKVALAYLAMLTSVTLPLVVFTRYMP